MSEDRGGEVVALRRDLAAAVRSGDKVRVRAVKAELDRVAGPKAGKETRIERADCPRRMDEGTR